MSDPTKYTASYNFSGFQAVNPSTPLPATQVDIQFAAIEQSTLELVNAIKDIRRSDGALANQSVGPDQLSPALSLGFTNRGTWVDGADYSTGDGVVFGTTFYSARVTHTSSTATRPDNDDGTIWQTLFTFESIIVADGAITPAKLSDEPAEFRDKLELGELAVENVAFLDARVAGLDEKLTFHPDDLFYGVDAEGLFAGKVWKWSSIAAALAVELVNPTPIGQVSDFAGTVAPTGWLFCYGQAISRSTYSALFASIGTTYGSGNGSTTFNVPDLRGRVVAGQDDMGGSSANRLTGQTGGLNGDNLGASGGAETHTLTTAQLASHTHAVDPPSTTTSTNGSHTHTVAKGDPNIGTGNRFIQSEGASDGTLNTGSDGSHTHTLNIPSFTSGSAGSGGAHNNVQPTLILNKIIYTGV